MSGRSLDTQNHAVQNHSPKRRQSSRLSNGLSVKDPLTIPDDEDETQFIQKNDVDDSDYEESTHKSSSAKKVGGRPPVHETWSHDTLKQEFAKLKQKRTSDRKAWGEESSLRKSLQNGLRNARSEIHLLQKKLLMHKDRYEAGLETQREQFAKAEKDLLQRIKAESVAFLADNVIRDKFRDIFARCKEWVKAWYRKDFAEELVAGLSDRFTKYMSEKNPIAKDQLTEEIRHMGSGAIRIEVYAALSRMLLVLFFTNPFRCFQVLGVKGLMSGLRKFEEDNLAKALAWRAHTVQLLLLHIRGQATGSQEDARAFDATCRTETRKFIMEIRHNILRKIDQEAFSDRRQQLEQIFIDARHLSVRLWSQRTIIEMYGENELCGQKFTVKSDMFEAHSSMGVEDDEPNNEFENKDIQLVLSPAIVAKGNAQGDNLDQEKVWYKAVVLVFEGSPKHAGQDTRFASGDMQPAPKREPDDSYEFDTVQRRPKQPKLLDPSRSTLAAIAAGQSTSSRNHTEHRSVETNDAAYNAGQNSDSTLGTSCKQRCASRSSAAQNNSEGETVASRWDPRQSGLSALTRRPSSGTSDLVWNDSPITAAKKHDGHPSPDNGKAMNIKQESKKSSATSTEAEKGSRQQIRVMIPTIKQEDE